jgi:hypothetical protein
MKSLATPLILTYLLPTKKVDPDTFLASQEGGSTLYKNLCVYKFFNQKISSHILLIPDGPLFLSRAEYVFINKKCFLLLPTRYHGRPLSQVRDDFYARRYSWWEIKQGEFHSLFLMSYLLLQKLFAKYSSGSEIKQTVLFLILYPKMEMAFYLKNLGQKKLIKSFLKADSFQKWEVEAVLRPKYFEYLFYSKFHPQA